METRRVGTGAYLRYTMVLGNTIDPNSPLSPGLRK